MAFATPTPDETPAVGGLRAKLARFWYPREYLLLAAFLAALGLGGVWGSWQNLCAGNACPSIAQVRILEHEQTSKIYTHDGRLITEFGFERRTPVSIGLDHAPDRSTGPGSRPPWPSLKPTRTPAIDWQSR